MARLSGTITVVPAPRVVIEHLRDSAAADRQKSSSVEVTIEQPSSDVLVATAVDPRVRVVIEVTARPLGLGSEVDYALDIRLRRLWKLGAPLLPFALRRMRSRMEDTARQELDALT